MNIFEALHKGKGRATLPEKSQHWVAMFISSDFRYNFVWSNDVLHGVFDIELRSNDWTPYVPPKERKIEEEAKFNDPWVAYCYTVNEWRKMGYRDDYIEKFMIKPYVPRETYSSCGQAMPSPKTKRTEVVEGVRWAYWPHNQTGAFVIYPIFDIVKKHSFIDKPPMKMTLEWEE